MESVYEAIENGWFRESYCDSPKLAITDRDGQPGYLSRLWQVPILQSFLDSSAKTITMDS